MCVFELHRGSPRRSALEGSALENGQALAERLQAPDGDQSLQMPNEIALREAMAPEFGSGPKSNVRLEGRLPNASVACPHRVGQSKSAEPDILCD